MNTALLHVKTTSHFPQQSIFQTRLVCGNAIDQRLFVQRLGVSYRSATPRHATPRRGQGAPEFGVPVPVPGTGTGTTSSVRVLGAGGGEGVSLH